MRFGPLIIAGILALVAGFVALKMLGGKAEEPAPVVVTQAEPANAETTDVYVAAQFIPIGTVITQELLQRQPWPSQLVGETFATTQQPEENVIGKVSRSSFQAGEPISLTKLAGADQGSFLAGSLPKGYRAVTINTDETLGVAGFVFPGDRVDVMITHQVPKWDLLTNGAGTEQIAEPLLSNVTVLAVDQIASAQEIAANSEQEQGEAQSTIHVARTVTLMVNPVDGEKLRLGEKVGQLSLALRSVEDRETVDMASLLRYQNITQFPLDSVVNPGGNGANGENAGIRIVRGTEAANVAPLANGTPASPVIGNPLLTGLQPGQTGVVMPSASPLTGAAADAAASTTPAVAVPAVAVPPSGPAVATPAPDLSAPAISAPTPLPAPPSATTVPAATQ